MSSTHNDTELLKQQAEQTAAINPYNGSEQVETEIDLIEMFYFLLSKIRWIILAALVTAVVALAYTYIIQASMPASEPMTTPVPTSTPMPTPTPVVYDATAKLYVPNSKESAIDLKGQDIDIYTINEYQEVIRTWEVREIVLKNLGLSDTDTDTDTEMEHTLSVSNPGNTRILNITVSSTDPAMSSKLANEYAAVSMKYINTIMLRQEPNILSIAQQPTSTIDPVSTIEPVSTTNPFGLTDTNKIRTVMLGFILGGVLMTGFFIAYFMMDDKLKTPDDIAKYAGLVTLAIVPAMKSVKGARPNGLKKPPMPVGQERGRG